MANGNPITLYEQVAGVLPVADRWVLVSHPDGTRWAIPAASVLDEAYDYYSVAGWDEEDEAGNDGQPEGDELRGILEVNADLPHAALESRWSDFAGVAVLLSGPGTVPPGDDKLWWFDEAGGSVAEMTTVPPEGQIRAVGRVLWVDDLARLEVSAGG